MKPYTVLLLYPDYLANEFGSETYLAHVEASEPETAITRAQLQSCEANCFDESIYPNDFAALAVFEGHLEDLKP